MGKIRGILLLLALGISVSTGQVKADETITNCAQVTAASPDDTDSTPNNADFNKDPALFEDDESCARVTKVIPYDYGDAPDPTYPTTEANTGAKHLLGGDVYLGSCVDADTGTLQGDATADDQNAGEYTFGTCNGTDDEDGVTFPALYLGATGLSLDIVASQTCKLNAWIDWNGDGDWNDADEQIATDIALSAGNNSLPITLPASTKAGDTYARFRCSTAGGDGITGEAADGEVEDYPITIKAVADIQLKKYVQQSTNADGSPVAAFDINTPSTWGADAQDDNSAKAINYGKDALYTLIVKNTGHVYLSDIQLDDEMQACTPAKVYDSNASTHDGIMAPNETWAFQCTVANIQHSVTNLAKVRATPIEQPAAPSDPNETPVPTGQTPPSDVDPAVVTTTVNPAISLKKYVMPAPDGTAHPIQADDTYGAADAQDNASAQNIVYGESATYRIRVENTGTTWLDHVVVDDVIDACDPLEKKYDSDAATPDGVMSVGEVWWLECTLPAIKQDITNIATVTARPIHKPADPADTASYQATGQSPVSDTDPANVTTNATPAIVLKKYVQPADTVKAFDANDVTTWGQDAQGSADAVNITYNKAAVYRIKVQNTGAVWLSNVVVEDAIDGCNLAPIGNTDSADGFMEPNEVWWFECTVDPITQSMTNFADVRGTPSDKDKNPTGDPDVTSRDPASVDTSVDPRIELKKYVIQKDKFTGWTGDVASLGNDAQDAQSAEGIDYGKDALYSITVQNTGASWLDSVAVDDLIDACDPLDRIDNGDGDANDLLAPNEMWVYQCTLSNVTEPLANTAKVTARPVNADGTPTNQSPVSDTDPAHIKTGAYSIGNMIWVDDGAGNATYRNDGIYNNGESLVGDNVVVELRSADLSTVIATTTTSNGLYLFDHLAAGQYQVCIAESNFSAGQALAAYLPGTAKDEDPENNTDSDDNGDDDITGGVCSGVLTLDNTEPTGETPANGGSAGNDGVGTADNQSNLTVDFAVIPSYSLGNQIWIDSGAALDKANNGQFDAGEGLADGVLLELLDGTGTPTGKTTISSNGFYQFGNLEAGNYQVRIAASNFAQGGVLEGYQSCTHGNEADANANGDGNDNGIDADPTIAGITTSTVTLGDNEPLLESPTQSGTAGNDGSNRPDAYNNLTVDLCVVKLVGLGNRLWIDESDPAARDKAQIDNHVYDANEEPVANTEVQVFPDGADPKTDAPYATTTSDAQGCYHVNNLPEGRYFVHIPASEFAKGKPLNSYVSSTNAGSDDGNDENVDENGIDTATPETDGISTNVYELWAGEEATNEANCGDNPSTLPDNAIDDTADLSFIRANKAGVPAIDLVKYVQPATGAKAYDANNDDTLGKDAQTDNTAVFIPYGESALYRITVKNTGTVSLANIKVDDKVSDVATDCDLKRIDPAANDTRVVLQPNERWVYECTLDNIQQDIVNIAEVTATPIEPVADSSDPDAAIIPTGQSTVRDSDPAHIDTGSYSIGNMVWIDDGNGNATYANNGKRDHDESVVPNGVVMELRDASGQNLIATTLTTDGYYLFHHLPAGDYQVCVAASNFNSGALLAAYGASNGQFEESDPNADVDNNDNGDNDLQGGLCSGTISLADNEPLNETSTDGAASGQDGQGTDDNKSNLTIDFGIVPTYSIGNQIWIDDGAGTLENANNGKLDAGEQPVPDTVQLELLDANDNVVATTTPSNGFYLFDNLSPADYKVRIAASNFAQGGVLEGFQSCTNGNEADANYGADGNDNGLDSNPVTDGISTSLITLGDGEPTLEQPTQSGIAGNDGSNRPDAYNNLTVDLCVVKLVGLGNRVWIDESDPAARDGSQINNGKFDSNEAPAANIDVEVYPEGADPKTATPYAVTTTDAQGCYHFNNLPEGRYFVHLPATNFATGNLLEGLISSTGAGADDGTDEDADENGVDGSTPKTDGISSIVYELWAGEEKTGEPACGNNTTNLADNAIDDTADFGLVRAEPAKKAAIRIKKYVQPAANAPAYDDNNAATLGQDAQSNDAAVSILYRETALYRIVVENTGDIYLADVNPDDEIADCNLQRIFPSDNRVVLAPGEHWVYECTLDEIKQDITNIAKVSGTPIEPPVDSTLDPNDPKLVITPTGQTPASDIDPAVITTEFGPAIDLKKFVQDKATAPALVEGDTSTYGADAQDDRSAYNITYAHDALYRIRVMNTGTTWLNNVVVDERLAACENLTKVIDTDNVTPDGVMSVGEIWWFECTLPKVIEPVSNIADVKATPVHLPKDPANPPAELEPTGQAPVYDTDSANVTTYIGPKIEIKKYVQPADSAKAFDANDATTWGEDAQDSASAVNITYTHDALYRIKVTNLGETWLDQVEVDDQIAGCDLQPIAGTTDSSDKFMSPNEVWWFECTLANITDDVTNIATVEGIPTHDDKTPTEHAPVNDTDPAFIHTTADPVIVLKKYVQDAATAPQLNPVDDTTLGKDAQDAQHAVLIPYQGTALYRIKVSNTGATWLDNVVVDDVLDNCDLQRVYQSKDADEVLAPNEYWIYECTLDNVTDELLANTATVSARPINEDGSSRDQSPVTSTDPAHIMTGSHSIGNLVWIDDGKGNASYANNGKRDHDESVVPNGVVMELRDASGQNLIATTLTTDGYYLFHHLPAGDYQVCVAASNFNSGALLAAYGASNGQFEESDPNADVDNNDNGDNDLQGGLCSGTISLADNEPLNETSTDGAASGQDGQGTDDNKSNLTIDFGIVPTYSIGNQIWIDDGAGTLENANNGKLDAGEQPVPDTVQLELLDANDNVVATTTPSNGFYLFDNLSPADYKVRIAASNFAQGGVLEGFQSCTNGNEADANYGADGNDNGLDSNPVTDGISTSLITLGDGEPTLEQPTQSGIAGNDGSNRPDAYNNLTVDLCVVKLVGLGNRVWIDESDPQNRDNSQVDNAIYDNGELTVADAEVQLFPEGADPTIDDYYAVTTTDRNGCYHFNNLPEGKYFVHIPAYQAVVTGDTVAALSAYVSSTGEGADNGVDDNQDENGKDDFTINSAGISSIVFDLQANNEPVNERACGNNKSFIADNSIDDTADFGLVSDLSLGDRIWIDGNANGKQDDEEHPLPGAKVELLQNGQTIQQATSDANGNYLFDHLTPGDYQVKVTPPAGYYPTPVFSAVDANQGDNNGNNDDSDCQVTSADTTVETGIITLKLGAEPIDDGDFMNPSSNLSIDCGFYRPVAVGNMIWEDLKNVDGINNENQGLENIKVELLHDDNTPVIDVFGNVVTPVTTAADGKYLFDNLTPGSYIIKVTPPTLGYELTINSGAKPDENPSDVDSNCLVADNNTFQTPAFHLYDNAEPESTVDGDDQDRDMTVDCGFYRPVAVGNIVWVDENGNGIRESHERLLPGAIVTLLDANGDPALDIFGNEVAPVKTDENGEYHFTNLASGEYMIQVQPPEGFLPTIGVNNPNDDYNFDSNCLAVDGSGSGIGVSGIISLIWGQEPTNDGDSDFATNQTVGCGFKPDVFNIPTLSQWAYLVLMILLASIVWRVRGVKR